MQANPFDGYILGYPVKFTEHCQTLGVVGDLVCVNMSGYYAATKAGGVDFASSMHLYFDQNLTAFRWTFRLAGQPILSKPCRRGQAAPPPSRTSWPWPARP
jgi:HK97 family phage major capsid protein